MERVRGAIQSIRQQYIDNGIGRWAVIDKNNNAFLGWSGLKLIKEATEGYDTRYDLGYRFLRKYWGKGYATETAIASVNYGFQTMGLTEIVGQANIDNIASRHVLEKAGLKFIDKRYFDGIEHDFLSLKREEWNKK